LVANPFEILISSVNRDGLTLAISKVMHMPASDMIVTEKTLNTVPNDLFHWFFLLIVIRWVDILGVEPSGVIAGVLQTLLWTVRVDILAFIPAPFANYSEDCSFAYLSSSDGNRPYNEGSFPM
jgi:hypothetical protein